MGTSLITPALLDATGPTAITALLGQLVGAQQAPQPATQQQASPDQPTLPPQASPAPSAASLLHPPQRSMIGRVVHNLLGIPGAISNGVRPDLPPEAQPYVDAGLITPEQAAAARPSFIHSLIGGENALGSTDQYRANLQGIINAKKDIATMIEHQRIMQNRAAVEQKYPLPQNPTDEQLRNNLAQRYDAYLGAGDTEMVKDVGARLSSILASPKTDTSKVLAPGGVLVDPTGKVLYSAPAAAPKSSDYTQYVDKQGTIHSIPKDQQPEPGWKTIPQSMQTIKVDREKYVWGVDPQSGQTRYVPEQVASAMGYTQPKGAAGGGTGFGSAGIGGTARQMAAIVGLDNANGRMVPFEQSVANHTASFNGLDYWKGMRARMYDAKGIIDEGVHAAVYAKLNAENPELANYLMSAEQWALEDSQLSNRPSDFRTKLDNFVSTMGPNATPKNIANIQSFRSTRLNELAIARKAMEAQMARIGGTPSGPAGPSDLQSKYDAAYSHLKGQGKTDAQIKAQIGARP